MTKLRVATVFSGIGAFEFALKRLNIDHEVLFACDNGERDIEYDKEAEFNKIQQMKSPVEKMEYVNNLYASATRRTNFVEKSYKANYKIKDDLFFQDICLLDGTDFEGKVDIFVGGSPCQSFSCVGCKKGLEDARGTLFYEYARLIDEIKPKVFIYENVRNMKLHDNGNTWDVISGVFKSLGYHIKFDDILNASDFGIPQKRRRLFVIGFRDDVNFELPEKLELKYKLKDFTLNNCSFGNFKCNKKGKIAIKKGGELPDPKYTLSPKLYAYVMKSGTKTWYQNPAINQDIARTLLKTMGNRHRAGVDNYLSFDGTSDLGSVRMLTEREALRLMGFTDDFNLVVSRNQAYKQAGNSIVVDVLIAIINQIFKTNIFNKGC